jgi:glycosyltransferase involved in cell wall biosynthesis
VIIYRHLKRLKEHGHTVLVINNNPLLYPSQQNGEFEVINLDKKWWFPPLRKKTPLLTNLRTQLYFSAVLQRTCFKPGEDIILGLLGETSNLLILKIYENFGLPYYLFYHDDTLFNRYARHNILSKSHIRKILTGAARIFAVSASLVNLLHAKEFRQTCLLYPIPEGYKGEIRKWDNVNQAHLHFCASGMIEHIHFPILKKAGNAIRQINGVLNCIGNFDKATADQLGESIEIVPRFDTLKQLFRYITSAIDVLVIFYSFDPAHEPRMLSSFPSKLLEYCHLGLPILIIAPPESTLGEWALEKKWHSYLDTDDTENILSAVKKFKDQNFWLKCQQQSLETAGNKFDPERIHRQFISQLNIGQPAAHA